jgi:membrane fusion protein, multidrug efflux system
MRRAVTLLAGLLLTGTILVGCGRTTDARTAATGDWAAGEQESWNVLAVEAVPVRRDVLIGRVEGSALLSGTREVEVVTETQGLLQDVRFQLGERVEAGAVLVRFEDTVERLQMEQAREERDTARLDLAALESLFERGQISRVEMSRSRSAAAGAESRYESARKAYNARTVRSPIEGYIAAKDESLSPGAFLPVGTRVARVVDISRLQARISVGEREVAALSIGSGARVRIPACDTGWRDAVVTAIAAGSDPGTGSFPVVVEWDNSCTDRVRSGMSVQVQITPAEEQQVLLIPGAALVRVGDGTSVFRAVDGRAELTTVTTGRRSAAGVEILSGLSENDLVVVSALSALRDGARIAVTVRDEDR